jgi:hypothetical protein
LVEAIAALQAAEAAAEHRNPEDEAAAQEMMPFTP